LETGADSKAEAAIRKGRSCQEILTFLVGEISGRSEDMGTIDDMEGTPTQIKTSPVASRET
jgi:hypothetical protein